MSPDPDGSSGAVERPETNDYDGFAEAYTAATEADLVNAHYERPAILALAGDVAGRRAAVSFGVPLGEAERDALDTAALLDNPEGLEATCDAGDEEGSGSKSCSPDKIL